MSPVTGLAQKVGRILSSVHMGNLTPVTEMKNVQKAPKIPVDPRSDPRSGYRDQPSFSYEYIEFFVKKGVARRYLGNRASPVDRAPMKRP